jgi:Tol biopolymer transport system component
MAQSNSSRLVGRLAAAILVTGGLAACAQPVEPTIQPTATHSPAASAATSIPTTTATATQTPLLGSTPEPVPIENILAGTQIAFIREVDKYSQVFVLGPDGITTQITFEAKSHYVAAFSPDGRKLAYFSELLYSDIGDIYVVNRDGTGLVHLAQINDYMSSLAWSPGGKLLAYAEMVRPCGQPPCFRISTIEVATAQIKVIATVNNPPTLAYLSGLAWSHDGSQIAYSADYGSGFLTDIYLLDIDSQQVEKLLRLAKGLAWSPDGTQVAMAMPDPEKSTHDIYVMNSDGTNLRNLTNTSGSLEDEFHPVWSPSGKYLCYNTYDGAYVLTLDGSVHQLMLADGVSSWAIMPE